MFSVSVWLVWWTSVQNVKSKGPLVISCSILLICFVLLYCFVQKPGFLSIYGLPSSLAMSTCLFRKAIRNGYPFRASASTLPDSSNKRTIAICPYSHAY